MNEINENTTPNWYVKISKDVISEKSISEHRVSILTYFFMNKTIDMRCLYSPVYMIGWCGYSTKLDKHTDRESTYTKFLSCMNWFAENGYIENYDSKKFASNNLQASILNGDLLYPKSDFAMLYDFEIQKILGYKSAYRPLTTSVLLLTLAYIRAYTFIRVTNFTKESNKSKKEKPEFFSSTFDSMSRYINVNRKLISRAVEVLEDMGFIKTHREKTVKKDDKYFAGRFICVTPYKYIKGKDGSLVKCDENFYNWHEELTNGIEYMKNKKFEDKKFDQEVPID